MSIQQFPISPDVSFDWNVNDPTHLRERAEAILAWDEGKPVEKWTGDEWILIEDQTAFFFERRYRAALRQ